eukprot:gene29560-35679_t
MGNKGTKVQDYYIIVHSRSTEHSVDGTLPEQNARSLTAPSSNRRMSKAKSMAGLYPEFGGPRQKDPKQRPKSAKARLSLVSVDQSKEGLQRASSMRPIQVTDSHSPRPIESGVADVMMPHSKYPWMVLDWKVPHHFKPKDVQLRETLGHGYMGKVKLASVKDHDNNKRYIAVKIINKDNSSKNKVGHYVESEKHAMRLLNARSQYSHMICKYFGSFEDKQTIYLCLEYIPGRAVVVDPATQTRRLHTVCGTPAYLSPEQLDSKFTKGYTYIVDYWALGIICYELCYGDTPFSSRTDSNSYEIFLRILQNNIHFPYRLFNRVNAHTKALICALCHAETEKRLCHIQDIKSHPFFVLPWDAVREQRVNAPYVPKVGEPSEKKKSKDREK